MRWLHPAALPKRADAHEHHRTIIAWGGVVALTTVVFASVALATTPTAAHKHQTAAQRDTKIPPSYTLPVGTLLATGKLGKPSLSGDTGKAGVPVSAKPPTANTRQVPVQSAAIATYQGGSGTLTPAGIATLALQHGCSSANAVTATAISMAESGGSPAAQGDIALMNSTWDWSAGLWQIRGLRSERGTGALRDSVANQDAAKNAAAMYVISSGCTSWGPWSTYNNGAYERFLMIATQAVNYVVRYFDAHGHHYPTVAPPDPNAPIPSGSDGSNGSGAQAAGPAPASAKAKPSHSTAAAAKPAAHSSTAAQQPAAGGGGNQPAAGGAAKASPTPVAANPAKSAASKVTKPVKGVTSAVGSVVKSVLPTCTPLLPIGTKCKPKP
ncbi:hypothetical protein [uncultured Jatrophihabitans sp.]|uniref:hypothetical protein n=1 Tax=uncultured Jatrophihabitans sp. TaxID=1610747 RepID=UPI0035C966EC